MVNIEEQIKSLSIEERAVKRGKQILSHQVSGEDIKHLKHY